MSKMIDVFGNDTDHNMDEDFPDYSGGKPFTVTVKKDPIPESEDIWKAAERGENVLDLASNIRPIASPEEMETIREFFRSNPQFAQGTAPRAHHFTEPASKDPFHPEEAWIQTYSGRRFNPTNPHVDAIVIQDIAHSLSMQCRFSGHCKKFYSVAQHSVLVSHICNHEDALWGLLHDASEAYLIDIPRPLKRSGKFEAYRDLEVIVTRAICKRFGLPEAEPYSVKRADTILLSTEARDLMYPLRADWVQPTEPLPFKIESWSPQEAKNQFMKRFFSLIGADPYHYQHYLEHENNA